MAPLLLMAVRIVLPPGGGDVTLPEGKCIRAAIENGRAELRVNGLAAGEVREDRELDITPYLRAKSNEIRASSGSAAITLLIGPKVFIAGAVRKGNLVEVSIANTTEHTMQVELDGKHQFTVSPGTAVDREIPAGRLTLIRMRATSDGLDLAYEDEAEISESTRKRRN